MTFGCHPGNAALYNPDTELDLWRCLRNDKAVAVGEVGLDDFCGVSMDLQMKVTNLARRGGPAEQFSHLN